MGMTHKSKSPGRTERRRNEFRELALAAVLLVLLAIAAF
jgi:hypothetical protein